jgi:glyoxylate reductase
VRKETVAAKIFVTRPVPRAALDALAAKYELDVRSDDKPIKPEQLASACKDAEGLMVVGARVTEEVLKAATRLRAISNTGVGYDNIDVAGCTSRKIPVTNTAGVLEETTADLAFGLLLAVARRIVLGDRYIRDDRWHHWQWNLLQGFDVHHKTLGIYGLGKIGQAMARRGRGFGMPVIYHQRRPARAEIEREIRARFVDRETLFRESDFVSLHIPLTMATDRTIGASELRLMKPSAFLINTARGRVLDEGALVEALERGLIAGAALDVFEREPQLHPGLEGKKNLVFTPHIGSATIETRFRMAQLAAENLAALLEGQRPPNVVNPEVFG